MNWLVVAIAGQAVIGSSAVFDKILLKRRSIEPWGYTFWLGVLGLFAVVLLPFGYMAAPPAIIALALIGGAAFLASAFFAFRALEKIEASESLPLLGAFSPIATLIFSLQVLGGGLNIADIVGFAFLILASFVLFLAERRDFKGAVLPEILMAALLLGASHVISKIVFEETSFIIGFFWVKMGGVAAALALLFVPRVRTLIKATRRRTGTNGRFLYFANRGYAALGSLLTSYAIALSQPALVDATQNVRYLTIFILAWIVLRERFRGRDLFAKLVAAMLIVIGLASLALGEHLRATVPDPNRPIAWGVTFSQKFSRELNGNWRGNFLAVTEELRPERMRLIAYWDELEPERGEHRFEDLDWQIAEAERAGIPVVLAMGLKMPRWPECHLPLWAATLPAEDREAALGEHVSRVVERYKARGGVVAWQVENEPFLAFGECPERPEWALEREIEIVRAVDASRPILVTDSGELGLWYRAERHADIFGTTMYRKIYPRFIGPIFGTWEYPLPPDFFRAKEHIVRLLSDRPTKRFVVIELQGEPWEPRSLSSYSPQELVLSFSPEYFRDTIRYAEETGFEEYYLWGVEWWYWMKEMHGVPDYWDIARNLVNNEE
ncbi:DMT family transporter [Candidatus Parcubacteria bacterium]|nr:MAG: DMT family transporter [Candidatus Parcubacteria bacterium]